MKNILVNLIKLLYTLMKYLNTVITFKVAFLISALKNRHCFDLSREEDDVEVIFH